MKQKAINIFNILLPYIFIILGFLLIKFLSKHGSINLTNAIHDNTFISFANIALAIGLYGSVYGIEINKLIKNKKLIVNVITIGVIFKIIFIGTILYIITKDPISFLLATIIAQIDPLSVASLEDERNKLSKDGKTILRAWASFDDPMTVIFSILISILLLNLNNISNGIIQIIQNISLNLLFASLIYLVYKTIIQIKHYSNYLQIILLIVSFIIAIRFELFFGIAIIGLFLRPTEIKNLLDILLKFTLFGVSFIIGILIYKSGVNIFDGIILGIATIISQIITTNILGKNSLSKFDKIRLGFAQQSGITAITLSIFFEARHDNVISTIVIAIITINILYIISNKILEYCIEKNILINKLF